MLRVDNQALSWVKTYSIDLGMVGRWLVCLDQYNMEIEHRPRIRHTNADGLSKRTNLYVIKERSLKDNPAVREGFNFLDQEVYDALPTLDSVDKHGRQMEPEQSPESEDSPKEADSLTTDQNPERNRVETTRSPGS